MGKIVDNAKFYADHYLPDPKITGSTTYFLNIFEAIESELQKLSELVGKELRGQDGIIGELKKEVHGHHHRLYEVEKRVIAHDPWKRPCPDVPTDKFGKPEGGLERGDWLIIVDQFKRKWFVIYHHREGKRIYGYFMCIEGNELDWRTKHEVRDVMLSKELSWFDEDKDRVTFEFRPRFPDRKES